MCEIYVKIDWPESQEWEEYQEVFSTYDDNNMTECCFVPKDIYDGTRKGKLKKRR